MAPNDIYTSQINGLVAKITARVSESGIPIATKMIAAADPILEWIGYLYESKRTGHSDNCLNGLRSLIVESVSGASAGLYRSCLMSMRGQIDLVLTWLYFKDHPIEWNRVTRENEGYRLKKDVTDYLRDYYIGYDKRFNILKVSKTRLTDEPYKTLSAHIHSIGLSTIPDIADFSDIVCDLTICEQCVSMQTEVSEYISDILLSCYGSNWASLPDAIMKPARLRVPADKYPILFG